MGVCVHSTRAIPVPPACTDPVAADLGEPGCSVLLADLQAFTMLQAYFDAGMAGRASFELVFRSLPPGRNFLVAAGAGTVLDWLEGLHLSSSQIEWLSRQRRFSTAFLRSLETLHFTGDVWGLPEGTPCFPDEPLLRITAPLREAQLVESRVLNLVHLQTVAASTAVRCVLAAQGRQLVDAGLRRADGAEAALLSARASYLAGFDGTGTVMAGARWGIPVSGTMAHSYVQVHLCEAEAFEHFARSQPAHTSLVIDTWDALEGARQVVALARRLTAQGLRAHIRGVRLDSGDVAELAPRVRAILDHGGLQATAIFASGDLDEHRIDALVRTGAPIDGFRVGTRLGTSADVPVLDCVYALVDYAGRPIGRRSPGQACTPGLKQVWRRLDADGQLLQDVVEQAGQRAAGEPLLQPLMLDGQRVTAAPELAALRKSAGEQLGHLPPALRSLAPAAEPWRPQQGPALQALAERVCAPVH